MNATGERIQQLRELHGYTQKSLAELAGISQPTVARIEQGESVSDESVEAVTGAFGVRDALIAHPPPVRFHASTVRFRAHASLRAWERHRAHRWGEIAYEVFLHLRGYAKFPQRAQLDAVAGVAPERAAALTREVLSLTPDAPIPNLVRTLERSGIRTFLLPLVGQTHAGFSLAAGQREPEPIVCLFRDVPADRARFTLAHEIGHLVLHDGRTDRQGDAEEEANRFAGAFLLPREPFLADLNELRANTLSTYFRLKPRWGVSIQAMIMRAHNLERVSDWQKRRLFQELSSRGWRTNEPVELPEETPRQLLKALTIAYGDPPRLGELAHRTGIPELLLARLFPEATPQRTNEAQVIELSSARRRPNPASSA